MTSLINAARGHRLTTIEGIVLASNRPMLKLMTKLGFSSRPSDDDPDVVIVERAI